MNPGEAKRQTAPKLTVTYFHPVFGDDGKPRSTANVIWAERDRGSIYYRVSQYAMKNGTFPSNHPCAPFVVESRKDTQFGSSVALSNFRERGYWASCFPEGDGITFKWWDDVPVPKEGKTPAEVMLDIEECFGWSVIEAGRTR